MRFTCLLYIDTKRAKNDCHIYCCEKNSTASFTNSGGSMLEITCSFLEQYLFVMYLYAQKLPTMDLLQNETILLSGISTHNSNFK